MGGTSCRKNDVSCRGRDMTEARRKAGAVGVSSWRTMLRRGNGLDRRTCGRGDDVSLGGVGCFGGAEWALMGALSLRFAALLALQSGGIAECGNECVGRQGC